MPNEEYQWLLRSPVELLRERLVGTDRQARGLQELLTDYDDATLASLVRDLAGHDLGQLRETLAAADPDQPTVVFAYTIKGWGLPTQGHPGNHSALLTAEQINALADALGADSSDPWKHFPPSSAEALLCQRVANALRRDGRTRIEPPRVPSDLGGAHRGDVSTQMSLGRILTSLARSQPEVAARIVTVSPDVASSTNTAGWINKVGVWAPAPQPSWFVDDDQLLLRWRQSPEGQHIELGIAEINLVSLLGELGATWSQLGEPLLPIGTIYDPFVTRALEPWAFGVYAGGQSILVGTPSGVTLAPEGGAHQSVITPSVGLEQPGVLAYEPAFAAELEWCLLHGLGQLGRPGGQSVYLRLSTRPLPQALCELSDEDAARDARRRDVLAGGYRLRDPDGARVTIAVVGALVPEAITAAERLTRLGLPCAVVVITSYDQLWRAFQQRSTGSGPDPVDAAILDRLFPAGRTTPMVTLLDGHPHTLGFLGAVTGQPVACLGVSAFGEGGGLDEVYRRHRMDSTSVIEAALDLLDA